MVVVVCAEYVGEVVVVCVGIMLMVVVVSIGVIDGSGIASTEIANIDNKENTIMEIIKFKFLFHTISLPAKYDNFSELATI
jgi:hypothetical protein